jgi:hypothetical protein
VSAESPTIEIVEEVEVIEVKTTEQIIREEFADVPILIDIARCESRFRQFENGKVLTGVVDPRDTGVFQVNTYYHLATANKLGYDIFSLKGNMEYARWLYNKEGSRPWNASKGCWGQVREIQI